jgi:tetratricopeptide (TPR) repeat protein
MRVTARTRVLTIVALAAAAAVAGTVGVTLLQTRGETTTVPGAVTKPREGVPPLSLDFGVRADPEARALSQAQALYAKGQRAQAAAIFSRYRSLDAEIGAAFARWPDGGLDELKRLVAAHPNSSLAELHLGWALLWSGRNADAIAAWQRAAELQPDSPAAVDAQSALHPTMAPGLPFILTELRPPAEIEGLPAAEQLRAYAGRAARPDANAKILYGIALWNLRRPFSAERQFTAAAKLAPNDPMARTAAAVGAFSKENPVRAFGRLGPLTAVFPKAPVVRFHLAVLLIWTKQVERARRQLRLVVAADPSSVYAQQARTLLTALTSNGTK